MDIGKEERTITIEPATVPIPQRERRYNPAEQPKPARRPAVAPKEAPARPGKAPERTPVKQP